MSDEAELLSEIERLRESGRNWHRSALSNAIAAQRAEAKVAEVAALADEWDATANPILRVAASRVRKALRPS